MEKNSSEVTITILKENLEKDAHQTQLFQLSFQQHILMEHPFHLIVKHQPIMNAKKMKMVSKFNLYQILMEL